MLFLQKLLFGLATFGAPEELAVSCAANNDARILEPVLRSNSELAHALTLARIERAPNLDAHRYRVIWVDREIDQGL